MQTTQTIPGKKIRAGILLIVLLFQITIWVVGFVTEQNRFVGASEIYIPVRLFDPYDQFRGSYLALELDQSRVTVTELDRRGANYVLEVDERGFVTEASRTSQTPKGDVLWVRDFSDIRYYTEESKALELEEQFWDGADMWIAVVLSDGAYRITDLIVR